MRFYNLSLAGGIVVLYATAACGGFLTAEKFPTTINDVSFGDRVENKAAGYAPYKDASAYSAIQLQSLNDALVDEVARIEAEHELYCMGAGANSPECQPYNPPAPDVQPPQNDNDNNDDNGNNDQQRPRPQNPNVDERLLKIPPNHNDNNNRNNKNGWNCARHNPDIPAGRLQPLGVPVDPGLDIYAKNRRGIVQAPFGTYRGTRNGKKHYHQGVDLGLGANAAKYIGTPVYATADGVVRSTESASKCKSAGNMISITHKDGFVSYYMHLDSILVKPGDHVQAGCQIGTMGHTGGSYVQSCPKMGPEMTHLHYELRNKGKPATMSTPRGQIKLNYVGTSFDPTETLKY